MDQPTPVKRVQLSKDQRRAQAEEATRFAATEAEKERLARTQKTERLRALRLAHEAERIAKA